MKHHLNKKLTVRQVLVFILLPLALAAIAYKFIRNYNAAQPVIKTATKPEPVPVKKAPAIDTSAMGMLTSYVDSMNNAGQLFGGSWSFYLANVDDGKAICKVDIDHGLAPASVMKVVTTGTALSLLGPGYRFTTLLQYDGRVDSSAKILNGNIYIKGEGDPSLGSETFGSSINEVIKGWATAIKRYGIDSIAGCIIGDAEAFESNPTSPYWTWEDMQCDYGTGPCGLNIHENVFDLVVTLAGKETRLRVEPPVPGLKLYNEISYNPSVGRSYVYVEGSPFDFERTALGEVSSSMTGHSAIPDPALFCAQELKIALKSMGIGVRDSATTQRLIRLNHLKTGKRDSRKIISAISSPTLSELVYHTNQVSQNFYAESILRELAWKINGFGNPSDGIGIIYHFWKTHGLDLRGICMVDGCGLARMNSITTHQLVEMLRVYAKDSAVFPTFYKSLPVAGETGTIRKLASGTEADDNLHAKSGTMARIKSYAGYVRTKSGKMLCFAMIGNNTMWSEEELRDRFARLFVLMARLP
jgi:D-alanyl-D-alanine carboxypeptidase/D-alanyl-D-alanine-endopeptidase (penicillin-binding protein 4)